MITGFCKASTDSRLPYLWDTMLIFLSSCYFAHGKFQSRFYFWYVLISGSLRTYATKLWKQDTHMSKTTLLWRSRLLITIILPRCPSQMVPLYTFLHTPTCQVCLPDASAPNAFPVIHAVSSTSAEIFPDARIKMLFFWDQAPSAICFLRQPTTVFQESESRISDDRSSD